MRRKRRAGRPRPPNSDANAGTPGGPLHPMSGSRQTSRAPVLWFASSRKFSLSNRANYGFGTLWVRRSVPTISGNRDNTADFSFPRLPVIVRWAARRIDPGEPIPALPSASPSTTELMALLGPSMGAFRRSPSVTGHNERQPVSRTRSSRGCSAGTFANFGFKRDTGIIGLLVSLWFGSSLRSKLRTQASFRTATLGRNHA